MFKRDSMCAQGAQVILPSLLEEYDGVGIQDKLTYT